MTGTTQRTRVGPGQGREAGRQRLAVAGSALAALAAYLVTLARPALSEAETALVAAADRSLGAVAGLLIDQDATSGGYELFLHAWLRGGDSEFWARLPSAVAMALAVAVTADLARRWWGATGAVPAGVFLGVSPMSWWYAQDARPYALTVLLAVAGAWLLLRAAERARWRWWVTYSVALTLLGLVQPVALLVVLGHPLLLIAGRQRNWRQWLWSVLDGLVIPAVLVGIAWWQATRTLRFPENRVLVEPESGRPPGDRPQWEAGLDDLVNAYGEASGALPYAALLGVAAVLGALGNRQFPGLLVWFALAPPIAALLGEGPPLPFDPAALVCCGPALALMAAGGMRKAARWQVLAICGFAAALAAPALLR